MTLRQKFSEFTKQEVWENENKNAEECELIADDYAIEFYNWMRKNDTPENADKYFHYTDKDMLNVFKEEKGL